MLGQDLLAVLIASPRAGASASGTLAGGPATALTKFTSDQLFNYGLSPDSRQVAIVRGRVASDVVLISSGPTASAPAR